MSLSFSLKVVIRAAAAFVVCLLLTSATADVTGLAVAYPAHESCGVGSMVSGRLSKVIQAAADVMAKDDE